jgi:hypothetical protein
MAQASSAMFHMDDKTVINWGKSGGNRAQILDGQQYEQGDAGLSAVSFSQWNRRL